MIHNDGILRVQLQNKNLRIFVNEHRTGAIERLRTDGNFNSSAPK